MNERIDKLLEQVRVNEQIERLAEQAGCTIDRLGYGEGNLEKFAELIVKDCVNQVSDLMDYTEYTDSHSNAVELKALRDARRVIQEHFGVE